MITAFFLIENIDRAHTKGDMYYPDGYGGYYKDAILCADGVYRYGYIGFKLETFLSDKRFKKIEKDEDKN